MTHMHNQKTRIKMSASQKKRDPKTRYKFDLTIAQIEKANATKKRRWLRFSEDEKYERLKNFISAGGRSKKDTSIEIKINEFLKNLGMIEGKHYERNVQIGQYNVDFLINNLYILEAYGDYWHKKRNLFPNGQEKRKKDLIKRFRLQKMGYRFGFLWESEINEDAVNVNAKNIKIELKKLLNSYYNFFDWESCSCG
jgi:very-short-patch-repair endonuclease